MTERELTLFSALTNIGDDLVLESGAFVPAVGGGASSSAEAGTARAGRASSARGAGKDGRSPWFIPATVAACAALIAVIGILVGVVGNAFGFFPTKPPEVTTETVTNENGEPVTEESVHDSFGGEDGTDEALPGYRVEANSYGETFTMLYCSDQFKVGAYFDNYHSPVYELGEAAYQRIKQTEQHLGVEIIRVGSTVNAYKAELTKDAAVQNDVYQMAWIHGSLGVTELLAGGHLLDLCELDSLNFRSDYWDDDSMEKLSIKGKRYLGYGDILLPETFAVGFNKEIAAEYGLGSMLYTLVKDKGWTLDKLEEYSALHFSENGDGKHDSSDAYGLSFASKTALLNFQYACGIPFVVETEGGPAFAQPEDSELRVIELDKAVFRLTRLSTTYMGNIVGSDQTLSLKNGRVFLSMTTLDELRADLQENQSVGILPYPLYDRDQEAYASLHVGGYVVVPAAVKHRQMVGDVIETLAYRSADWQDAYDFAVLGGDPSEHRMDASMLGVIRGSLTCDTGLFLSRLGSEVDFIVWGIPNHAHVGGEDYKQVYTRFYKNGNRLLRSFWNSVP